LLLNFWQNFFLFYFFILKIIKKIYNFTFSSSISFLIRPKLPFLSKNKLHLSLLDLCSSALSTNVNIYKHYCITANTKRFTIASLALILVSLGIPNSWNINNLYTWTMLNNYSI